MICQYCGTRYRGKECPTCGTPSGKKQPPACKEPLYGNYKWEQSVARSKAYAKQIKKDITPPPEWAKREEPSTPYPRKKEERNRTWTKSRLCRLPGRGYLGHCCFGGRGNGLFGHSRTK